MFRVGLGLPDLSFLLLRMISFSFPRELILWRDRLLVRLSIPVCVIGLTGLWISFCLLYSLCMLLRQFLQNSPLIFKLWGAGILIGANISCSIYSSTNFCEEFFSLFSINFLLDWGGTYKSFLYCSMYFVISSNFSTIWSILSCWRDTTPLSCLTSFSAFFLFFLSLSFFFFWLLSSFFTFFNSYIADSSSFSSCT